MTAASRSGVGPGGVVFCDLPLLLEGLAGVDNDELFTFSLDSLDDRISVAYRRRLIAREKLFVGSRSAIFEPTRREINYLVLVTFHLLPLVTRPPENK